MFGSETIKSNKEALIKELMERPPQDEKELQVIKDECAIFGGVIHGGKPVEIHWVSGKGWFWSFKDGKNGSITADEKDAVEKGLGYCIGVMIHEESHVLLSRPEVFSKELWRKKGFAMGYNWIEDCRIEYNPDLVVNNGKDGVRHHLKVDAAIGGGLDYTGGSSEGSMSGPKQKIGYIPKHMMFGAVMRQYFFHKEYVGDLKTQEEIDAFIEDVRDANPEVAEAFERVRPHLESYYKTIPGIHYPTEENVIDKAKESGKIYVDHVWPEYEKLVDQSYEDHTMQKLIEELLDGVEFGDSSEAGEAIIVIDFDSLPPEVQDEIKEKMQGSPGDSGQSEGQGAEESEDSGSEGGDGGTPDDEADSSKQGSFQDLSEESQEVVKEAFEKIPKKDRQEISEKADQEMGEVDKEVNDTLQGNSDQEKSTREMIEEEGGGEREEGEDQEEEKEGGQQDVGEPPEYQPRRDATPEEEAAIDEYEKSMIDKKSSSEATRKFYDTSKDLNPIISTLKYNLEQYFYPNAGEEEIFDRTGDRYDYERRREERTGEVNYEGRVYGTETEEVKRNYRFTILVDLSGSMFSRIDEVFKVLVIFAEVLAYLGIDFEIQGYSEPVGGYKHSIYREHNPDTYFGARVSEDDMREIGQIVDDVDGGTPTSKAMVNTAQHLSDKKHNDGDSFKDFLLVITDGSPTDSINSKISDSKVSAKLVVDSIRKMAEKEGHDLAILGFGIGRGTDFVQDIFGQLPLSLRSIIADQLSKYRKKNNTGGSAKNIIPDQISNAYDTAEELSYVLPSILEYILENWDEFG